MERTHKPFRLHKPSEITGSTPVSASILQLNIVIKRKCDKLIYLDNASISKPKPEVIETVIDVLQNHWGNASSVNYEFGLESERIVRHTKNVIAKYINCCPDEIILCGSGSEANSLAIDGFFKANINYNTDYFVTSTIEHSSILNNPKAKPIIFCNSEGFFKMDWIKEVHNSLVSLQFANSEIGTIQNMKEIIDILHNNNCVVHTDAVAAFGKISIDVRDLGVDMLSATAQKIGGIIGSAFLYVRNGIKLKSIIHGEQERKLRGSTYNTAAIAGFGKAVELIDFNEEKESRNKRDWLLYKLLSIDGVALNGSIDLDKRLVNNINICVHNCILDSQQIISVLDMLNGYCVSAGSACSAGNSSPSHVLKSIGMSDDDAKHSLRITIGDNTYEELDKFYNDFKNIVEQYKLDN